MAQTELNVSQKQGLQWKAGIVGSIVGGIVFGIMMAMMGMLPMIAGMVGNHSSVVGFVVHIIISFIFGIVFTIFAKLVRINAIFSGIIFGAILWFMFPFIMMPLMMGGTAFAFNSGSMMSLMGHLIYGFFTGLTYKLMTR